ncbi:MAG: lytic transglycosylase domain-containing protein [Methylophilaceae bacterium]|nr:MAG: lytic transglycosylase domain-containing protein [Methylophilaceae bacterium]
MQNLHQLLRIRLLVLCMTSIIASASVAASNDMIVLKAREAYDKENVTALAKYADQLQLEKHILAPYAQFWLMSLNLDNTNNEDIAAFLSQHEDYAFARLLRGHFLKKLGKQKEWVLFDQEYARYQSKDNAAVECLAAEAKNAVQSKDDLISVKHLWLTGKDQPTHCDGLFEVMLANGIIDEESIWQRFRMATAQAKIGLAKAILKRSKDYHPNQEKLLATAYQSPDRLLKTSIGSFKQKFHHEVHLFALAQLAKKDTGQATNAFKTIEAQMSDDEKSYFYATLGTAAAKRHEPEALSLLEKARMTSMTDEQVSWYARACLRASDWTHLLSVISQMKPEIAEEARWRYWKARAFIALQQENKQAIDILTNLASERHYYGWLAQSELKNDSQATSLQYRPSSKEVADIGKLPAIMRAKALLDLDLRWEGKLEWKNAMASLDDKKLLAAAYFANQQSWYDLAINTADDTSSTHDFSMRYLMPYRQQMVKAAQQQQIDAAWTHAIARQESRFVHDAKSHAGAAGVMQLMPTTARWAAKSAGIHRYKGSMIYDLDTNITIGTYYLSHTLSVMNGNKVMATAGYNAGPSRAKRWLAPYRLEGAIYAETIPFDETRVYVQRVMANMYMYKKQAGMTNMTLKQLMGSTPAKTLNN